MKQTISKPMRSGAWCRRWLAASLLGAWVALAAMPAAARHETRRVSEPVPDAYTERLLIEFAPWVGSPQETQALVHSLRSGAPAASTGAASVAPATGALAYGEVRLALKLAQGTLAQEGVAQPSSAQIQAALHGGTLDTADGPKLLPGVLPQRAQGMGWGTMAQSAGVSAQDLIPPRSAAPRKVPASKVARTKQPGKASAGHPISKPTAKSRGKKVFKTGAVPRKPRAKRPRK